MMMNNKNIFERITGICAALIVCIIASNIAYADQRPAVTNIEFRSSPRGMILVIIGTGPIRVDFPGQSAEQYTELTVRVNNARSAIGNNQTFTPPEILPLSTVTVTETPQGVVIVAKSRRGVINGPVDTRISDNQARILMTRDSLPELTWSPQSAAVTQAEIKPEPVDMKMMEERATRDMQAANGQTFRIDDQSQAPIASIQAPPPQQQRQPAPAVSAPVVSAPVVAQRNEVPVSGSAGSNEATRTTPAGELVRYRAFSRDPFIPLVRDTSLTDIPRVESLRLVGILEDSRERIALVEDFRNNNRAFALRTNDPVEDGRVLRIHSDRVIFIVRDFDVSRSYTLSLTR